MIKKKFQVEMAKVYLRKQILNRNDRKLNHFENQRKMRVSIFVLGEG